MILRQSAEHNAFIGAWREKMNRDFGRVVTFHACKSVALQHNFSTQIARRSEYDVEVSS